MFGSVLQFNVTQLLNVIAEQEMEKQQYFNLLQQLKGGQVQLGQVEMSQDGVRVLPAVPAEVPLLPNHVRQVEVNDGGLPANILSPKP